MSKLINIITGNHLSSKRDYLLRMSKKKPLYMKESKKFGINYFKILVNYNSKGEIFYLIN